MEKEGIVERVNAVFEESFEIEKSRLHPDAQLFTDLGLDSLDTVDLVVALQKKFGVSIRDDARVRDIRTLQDLYDFIGALQSGEADASASG